VPTQLIRGLYNVNPNQEHSVVTIGNFDGVHIGHQALLARVRDEAKKRNVPSMVMTFEPQPAEFFAREQTIIPRLTRWREKFIALAESGIDYVLALRFNQALALLDAGQFIKHILVDGLDVHHIIVGDDFRFGKARQGDFQQLKKAGEQYGFTTEIMPNVMVENERVSSTRVRQALQEDNIDLIESLLGHPYYMEGRVVYGHQRGRSIGFPTANIYLHRRLTPINGVYVVRMHGLAEQGLPGVANIGVRPTVDGTRTLLEVHLFDFDQDIYRRQVRVEFCKKLRAEKRFDNLELLKEQIWRDAKEARAYFDTHSD
jgi:riboflavin kinase/FMN adenylyltransferase